MRSSEWLFIVALILYSLAIWSHKFFKNLYPWMVWVFGIGLSADILGTVFVCVLGAKEWQWNTHTISGLLALVIMGLHFCWVMLAFRVGKEFEVYFNRFSIWAWSIWLVAFISGIPR